MIEVRRLSYKIGDTYLARDINMRIKKGQLVGLIGPNGAGKTTILRCIYRANKNYQGDIFLKGQELRQIKVKDSAKTMAIVSQMNDMDFDFTVMEMVMLGRSPHKKFLEPDSKKDRELAYQAIRRVGLEGKEERFLSSLSGGEKQRVQLARALCQEGDILILDEPTNHLDIKYQLELLKLVKDSHKTSIAALHDINLSLLFCDYLYCLKDACLVAEGKSQEIINEEMIYKIYGVRSEILISSEGKKNIIWKL